MTATLHRLGPARREQLRVIATCLAAGILLAASLPPWGWWPLAFAGIVLLDRVLAGASWRSRLARGATVGFALVSPHDGLAEGADVPRLPRRHRRVLRDDRGVPRARPSRTRPATGPAGAWVLAEALRGAWPFGGVPLSLLATGQVAGPLAGLARVGGTLLISGATVAIGVGLSAALQRRWWPAAVAIVVPLVLLGVASVAPRGHDTGRRISMAFVQGGGPQGTRAIDTDMRKVFLRHLEASDQVPQRPRPGAVARGRGRHRRAGAAVPGGHRAAGARPPPRRHPHRRDGRERRPDPLPQLRPGVQPNGEVIDRYEKVHRVPFGEYVPFRSLLAQVAGGSLPDRDAIPGNRPAVLQTPVGPIAVVISWEVFFGNRARDGVNHGGQLLINPTNGSTYTGTLVQTQQIASSRLRAIETGRWEVQVAPTGFSAFVDPDGKVLQRTSVSEQAVGSSATWPCAAGARSTSAPATTRAGCSPSSSSPAAGSSSSGDGAGGLMTTSTSRKCPSSRSSPPCPEAGPPSTGGPSGGPYLTGWSVAKEA